MIDEATRERFIYPYTEQTATATKNFIQRAIVYFGYIPDCIQTDNGGEFTNPRGAGCKKVHIADEIMKSRTVAPHRQREFLPLFEIQYIRGIMRKNARLVQPLQ